MLHDKKREALSGAFPVKGLKLQVGHISDELVAFRRLAKFSAVSLKSLRIRLRRLLTTLERLLGAEDSVVAYRLTTERRWVGVLLPELSEKRVRFLGGYT